MVYGFHLTLEGYQPTRYFPFWEVAVALRDCRYMEILLLTNPRILRHRKRRSYTIQNRELPRLDEHRLRSGKIVRVVVLLQLDIKKPLDRPIPFRAC